MEIDEGRWSEEMAQDWKLPDSPEIDGRLQVAVARTSQVLSEVEMDVVRKSIVRSLDLSRQLRTLSLENHDEPEHGFDPGASRRSVSEDRSL